MPPEKPWLATMEGDMPSTSNVILILERETGRLVAFVGDFEGVEGMDEKRCSLQCRAEGPERGQSFTTGGNPQLIRPPSTGLRLTVLAGN